MTGAAAPSGPSGTSDPRPPVRVTEGRLSPGQAEQVLTLAAAAQAADGVAPLSENVLLQVRHGSGQRARDLLATVDDTAVGYAHLDGQDASASDTSASGTGDAGTGDTGTGDTGTGDAGAMSGELVIHPAHRRRGYGTALISAVTAGAAGHGTHIWAHGDLPAAAALARSSGFTRFRALWQMRMSLGDRVLPGPAFPPGVTLRAFRPGQDEDEWLAVNRRAFAHHPEQGSWTRKDLEIREAEPWFDPDGFFIAERDGRMAGFHWTKVHAAESGDGDGAPIGEVYVVGVDPERQGGGLGRALTLAGMAHLQRLGLPRVMLYVDESNVPAVKMYTSLGFARWHTDVMYRHP